MAACLLSVTYRALRDHGPPSLPDCMSELCHAFAWVQRGSFYAGMATSNEPGIRCLALNSSAGELAPKEQAHTADIQGCRLESTV